MARKTPAEVAVGAVDQQSVLGGAPVCRLHLGDTAAPRARLASIIVVSVYQPALVAVAQLRCTGPQQFAHFVLKYELSTARTADTHDAGL